VAARVWSFPWHEPFAGAPRELDGTSLGSLEGFSQADSGIEISGLRYIGLLVPVRLGDSARLVGRVIHWGVE